MDEPRKFLFRTGQQVQSISKKNWLLQVSVSNILGFSGMARILRNSQNKWMKKEPCPTILRDTVVLTPCFYWYKTEKWLYCRPQYCIKFRREALQ